MRYIQLGRDQGSERYYCFPPAHFLLWADHLFPFVVLYIVTQVSNFTFAFQLKGKTVLASAESAW
jgi:hypothetical protein